MKKTIVLIGHLGCGKTTAAKQMAENAGDFLIEDFKIFKEGGIFEQSDTLIRCGKTLILDNFKVSEENIEFMKQFICLSSCLVHNKHHHSYTIDSPEVILCSNDVDKIPLLNKENYFDVRYVGNYCDTPTVEEYQQLQADFKTVIGIVVQQRKDLRRLARRAEMAADTVLPGEAGYIDIEPQSKLADPALGAEELPVNELLSEQQQLKNSIESDYYQELASFFKYKQVEIENLQKELTMVNDIRGDLTNIIEVIAENLGVAQEPHQTFNERLIECTGKYREYREFMQKII